jgi:aspartyl protease family protein
MAQPPDLQREPERPRTRRGLYIWLGTLVLLGLGIWEMSRLFPGALSADSDGARLVYLVALVAFLSRGVIYARDIKLGQTARNIALWIGVVAVIAVGYMLKDRFHGAVMRMEAQMVPGYGVETAPHAWTLSADSEGNFDTFGQVNGATVRFTVDTGASEITLSPDDAKRAGIDLSSLTQPV